jgi:hypothetical protein
MKVMQVKSKQSKQQRQYRAAASASMQSKRKVGQGLFEICDSRPGSTAQALLQRKIAHSSSNPIQKLNLAKVDRDELPRAGKAAYDLLDDDRSGFKAIDKSGGDVHASQDGNKRVTDVYKKISSTKGGRSQFLQQTIGWLGRLEVEDISADYNGGHLIADSLGGSGTWQNMVPQDGPENRWGEWRQYERENAAALKETGDSLYVTVHLEYSGDSVLPTEWSSIMADKEGKDVSSYSAEFENL